MGFSRVPLNPAATVSTLVASKGHIVTILNNGPNVILVGTYNTIQQGDWDAIPLSQNQFIVSTGKNDIYAALPSGTGSLFILDGVMDIGTL